MSTTIAVRTQTNDKNLGLIGWVGPTAGICMTVACAVLFNLFPQKVGYYRTIIDPTSFVPLLGPGFAAFLPWLNLWWGLAISLEVTHLALGRWTLATRWAHWAIDVIGGTVLVAMAAGEPFVQAPVATLVAHWALALTGGALLLGALTRFVKLLKRLVEDA